MLQEDFPRDSYEAASSAGSNFTTFVMGVASEIAHDDAVAKGQTEGFYKVTPDHVKEAMRDIVADPDVLRHAFEKLG